MNKWKKRWWLLALMVVGMVLAFPLGRHFLNREPYYQGRRLSAWFHQYCRANSNYQFDETRRDEALLALRQLGTNALPYLLEQAFRTNRDSPFKTNLSAMLRSLPRDWGFSSFLNAGELADGAGEAIRCLKPPAHALLPGLTNLLSHPGDPRYNQALYLTGCIGSGGEEAVPYLVQGLEQQQRWSAVLAAQSLEWLGPQAKAALPAMIAALPNPSCTSRFIDALGAFGPDASAAVPALQNFLTHTNLDYQLHAAVALRRIDPDQIAGITVVREALQNKHGPSVRKTAVWLVQKLPRRDAVFAPELTAVANDTDLTVASEAFIALQKISPELAKPLFHERLTNGPVNNRLWAATRILEFDPNQPEALATLLQGLDDATWRTYAIDSLGRSGPNTPEIKALLQKLASGDPASNIRAVAQEALKRIERRARDAAPASAPQ